MAVENQH